MIFTIVGLGYVGLSLSILLSSKYEVLGFDIDQNKIDQVNNRVSPVEDKEIKEYFKSERLNLKATNNKQNCYEKSDCIIICTPTNFDPIKGSFDTNSVENTIKDINAINKEALIVIKSTIPFGFTNKMRTKFNSNNILFSPEFLRESKALYDNLYPSRIIVGDDTTKAESFANIMADCALKDSKEIPVLTMKSREAEAVKLFSNTYLAMRISFFNELDSFAEVNNLSSKKLITGISHDHRIGNFYNNPSFGYGGYCLPKDTKQLLENYNNIPNNIIKAVVESNQTRKMFIVNSILKKKPKIVGIYRLIMKNESDNFRESAVLDIIKSLVDNNMKVIVYEPLVKSSQILEEVKLENNFQNFTSKSDIIIANRKTKELEDFKDIVYSRDLFLEN